MELEMESEFTINLENPMTEEQFREKLARLEQERIIAMNELHRERTYSILKAYGSYLHEEYGTDLISGSVDAFINHHFPKLDGNA